MAGFGNAVENKVLDHLTGVADYPTPSPLYLALLTVAAGEADTAGTLTEANYTGYARLQVPRGDWTVASAGATATRVAKQFADCTAGTSTVIGWALVNSSAGAGDVVMFGSLTSVTISTTQTPASVASGALSMAVD